METVMWSILTLILGLIGGFGLTSFINYLRGNSIQLKADLNLDKKPTK